MKQGKVMLLDCTLRDGGRIIDCNFKDDIISGMIKDFVNAGIDIVEVGFLRGKELVNYKGNSTFFTENKQIEKFLPLKRENTIFTAFIDYGMYDFSLLQDCYDASVSGIRIGFTHKNYINDKEEIKNTLKLIKDKGYKLFVQNVNTPGYSDRELLDVVEMINEIHPYSYGIVDTYGSMYLEDMMHYYELVDYNLRYDCSIDIHSHNNLQSSFAFAQQIISMSLGKRNIILDSTLNGMGKCAGNLNTELIADYLTRKKGFDYDVDLILDMIDRYIVNYVGTEDWGYSIPAFMAGIYRAHPNNVIYLTQKYRLNNKDIKYILSAIDEDTRQRYDYDNIQNIYSKYNDNQIDDSTNVAGLKEVFQGKSVLILAPGSSVTENKEEILRYIYNYKPIVVGINYLYGDISTDYYFFANTIHWDRWEYKLPHEKCITTSNIKTNVGYTNRVNYSSYLAEGSFLSDNSMIMCLNLMKKLGVSDITMAGFDGLRSNQNNYVDEVFPDRQGEHSFSEINDEIKRIYAIFQKKVEGKISLSFLTESLYDTGRE
ncbi:aldolase catalytic domain-containing protein [Butyrivibrio sp. AC2005]|uniref:aldolase catalytic domain-containing protein n=1 Tax=Butyrivibrio sp. AC2005 TaxID=1280672 RepID=UPI0003F75F9F|nr:aldolase catalytic domain-containing protein [Butyrivibrio sp. AC2005]